MQPACIIVPFVLLAIVLAIAHRTRSANRVHEWAAANGYELLASERRRLFRGSFSFTSGEGQEVFRITVRDSLGQVRHGYIRVGGYFLGQLSDHIDVRWDS